MTTRGRPPPGDVWRRVAGFALRRAVAVALALLGSLLLMLVSVALGRWAALPPPPASSASPLAGLSAIVNLA